MSFFKKHWDLLLVGCLTLCYAIGFSILTILRHNAFASGYDLANMDQTVWNTAYGQFFSLTGDTGTISRFSIHADILLAILSPLYYIWNDVRMLLIAQSVAIALGALPTYLLAKKVLKKKLPAFVVVGMYFLSPGVQWSNVYDFHPVTFAMPLLITAFYAAYIKKWWLYVAAAALAITTKEQIALSVAMLGIYIFVVEKERKIGLASFIVGVTWFASMILFVIPYFSQTGLYWALAWIGFDGQPSQSNVLSAKTTVLEAVVWPEIVTYYIQLLKPYGFLPIIALPWVFFSLPDIFINTFTTQDQMRSYQLHYDSGITPALVVATIFSIKYLYKIRNVLKIKKIYKQVLTTVFYIGVIGFVLRNSYLYGPHPFSPKCWCITYYVSEEDKQFEEVLRQIPEDAVTTSSPEVRPHLTHREFSYTLPAATESADFVALITQNRIPGNYSAKEYELEVIKKLQKNPKYKVIHKSEHFYLFEKK